MSGHDAHLILHLNEPTWEASLAAAYAAKELLEANGYLVTQRPTLPHSPLGAWVDGEPADLNEFMEGDE